jgi:hypothetical protein
MAKDFEAIEKNAPETGGDISWYGKEDATEEHSIHDEGKGEPVVVRLFEFKFRPDLEKLPTKSELLTPSYIKSVDGELWGDGLRRVAEPRIQISKEGCKIFVPCQAATGHSHLEEPKLLQEWL